jgi:DNA-binding LacI/PurR family transcriptional regulator
VAEELAQAGLDLKPTDCAYAETYLHDAAGNYARRWLALSRNRAPTAVICANDELALGFMRIAMERGIRVPEQVSIIGFDGIRAGALTWPGLTTVRQPLEAMGQAAIRTILESLESASSPARRRLRSVELEAELVIRESTASPA